MNIKHFFKKNYRRWFKYKPQDIQKEIIQYKLLDSKKFTTWKIEDLIDDDKNGICIIYKGDDEIATFSCKELYQTYMKSQKNKIIKRFVKITGVIIILAVLGYQVVAKLYYNSIISLPNAKSIEILETEILLKKEVQTYISSKANTSILDACILVDLCVKYNINIILPLSQGLCESHYGTIGMAKKTNQIFNVGAYDGWTHDDINPNHKFDNPNQSIRPYLILLKNKYLVKKTEEDLLNNFVDKNNKRYATAENYEISLKGVWLEIVKTTKIDSLYQRYNNLLILK